MKVFICTAFVGYSPPGTPAIIVAEDSRHAADLFYEDMTEEIKKMNFPPVFTISEIPLDKARVIICGFPDVE